MSLRVSLRLITAAQLPSLRLITADQLITAPGPTAVTDRMVPCCCMTTAAALLQQQQRRQGTALPPPLEVQGRATHSATLVCNRPVLTCNACCCDRQ
jgi:hypothetical protein